MGHPSVQLHKLPDLSSHQNHAGPDSQGEGLRAVVNLTGQQQSRPRVTQGGSNSGRDGLCTDRMKDRMNVNENKSGHKGQGEKNKTK